MEFINTARALRGLAPQGEIPPARTLLQNTLQVAWPSILESFLIALVGMIDTAMVSTLGSYAIAAVGLTTQPKFIGLAMFISLNVAVSAIVARRRGEEDQDGANRVLVQALFLTIGLTVFISTIAVFFAPQIIRFSGSAQDTHMPAVTYFRIIMGGLGFSTISMVINAAQRGAGNTKIAMRTNMTSNLVNVFFNYLLIGGKLGFPRLGIAGAAIATVIGSVFACIMSLRSVIKSHGFLHLEGLRRPQFDRTTLHSLAIIGGSTLAEQSFMRFGFLLYSILVAKLGTTAFAAHQIGMNVMTLSFSFGDGLSSSAIALVGRSLGSDRPDLAKLYGGVCQRIGLLISLVLSAIYLTLGRPIYLIFSNEQEILDYGVMIMSLMTIIVLLQISQVIFASCLRGGGDTLYTAFVSLVSVSIIRPLAGWFFCYPLGLGLFGAWLGISFDQGMRFILTSLRFRSGKWVSIKI